MDVKDVPSDGTIERVELLLAGSSRRNAGTGFIMIVIAIAQFVSFTFQK